jgi:uncharacterized protein YndB with AHSA1/START domain
MAEAVLVGVGPRPVVRLERLLELPPEQVWTSLTDRERIATWFPCDVEVDGGTWQVGAALTFRFPPEVIDLTLTGEVLTLDRPKLLRFSWGDEVLGFTLERRDGATVLTLDDELAPNEAARNAAGWDVCLDRLAGLDPDPDAWQPRFYVYVAAFEPVLGPQAGPPDGYRDS